MSNQYSNSPPNSPSNSPSNSNQVLHMTLQEAANVVNGSLMLVDDVDENTEFSAIATDTRKSMNNSLFVALKGESFNAHNFLTDAQSQGAIACLIDESVDCPITSIKVSNAQTAMGELSQALREQSTIPFLAITGSCGKTTVKEMLASILSVKGKVLATKGNFNNAIGVPLTLFRLTESDEYAVIEMGASQPGDIDEIAHWAKPNVAVITNVSAAHLQGLGDIEGVSRVKGELLNHIQNKGTAVLEQDSPWLESWKLQLVRRNDLENYSLLTFSASDAAADFYASAIKLDEHGQLSFTAHHLEESIDIELPLSGQHNVNNALAAMAAAFAVGASLEQCQQGLASVSSVKGRLQFQAGIFDSQIIDDSYNANPASLKVALQLLASLSGKRVLILGDMAELGDQAISAHQQAGELARSLKIDALYATGKLSKFAVESFGNAGKYFSSKELLSRAVTELLSEDAANSEPSLKSITKRWNLLVKGSRSAGMEQIVKLLTQQKQQKQIIGDTTCC